LPTITMTSKGQITLPAATRAKLRLVKGAKMDVEETADGKLVLTPKPQKTGDIRRLRGILKYDGPPVSIEEMNASIGRAVSESYKRSIS
jgi:AbrB family looped-hinge helix DNA binding protein